MYKGFIETVSDTKFSKAIEVQSWKHIAVLSEHYWPSWLPLIALWFSPSSSAPSVHTNITIVAKSRQLFNLFGLNRTSGINWRTQNLTSMSNQQIMEILLRIDACFFDGSLQLFRVIYRIWESLPSTLRPHLICAMPNRYRLFSLSQSTEMIWKRASHCGVGGVTTSQIWIGFTMPTLPMPDDAPTPKYCHHVVRDLLEFAPDNTPVMEITRVLVVYADIIIQY